MIAMGKIAEVMINRGKKESISNVQIQSDGAVFAKLDNWVEPKRPYNLMVIRLKPDILSISIFPLLKLRKNSRLFCCLAEVNFAMLFGCLCVNPSHGEVFYRVDLFCENNEGPSPEYFELLLLDYIRCVRGIEQILLFETLIEVGFSEQRAKEFVRLVLGDTSLLEYRRVRV